MRARLFIAGFLLLGCACAQTHTSIGPLTLRIPDGWQVTDRSSTSIKLTNGTVADDNSTKPGTATAVFDVYLPSSQTVEEFRAVLREQHVIPTEEQLRVGRYAAIVVSYGASAFGPPTEVAFIPDWRVQIVYRAALPTDLAAFANERPAFRRALRSIRFSGRPASPRA